MSIAKVKEKIMSAPLVSSENPEPLRKPRTQETPFPVEALTPLLRNAVLGLHDKIQAPIAICIQSLLGAVNLVVQGHANVKLPFGQEVPISCYFLTIAESGERKSSCDKEALAAIRKYEEQLKETFKKDLKTWHHKNDAWEQQRKQILTDKKKYQSLCDKEKALQELGEQPNQPLIPVLVCPDPTFEGLCKLLEKGQPSVGLFSAEGGIFIGGHGMHQDNKMKTAAAISSMWDGEAIKRVRSGDGVLILHGRRLAMHLMVQPVIAANFLTDATLKDQGLLSRILVASPQTAVGKRLKHDVKSESIGALTRFEGKLVEILSTPLPLKENCTNELFPKTISMTDDAIKAFYEFSDHIEKEIASGKSLESIRGFANKLPEHAVRIAVTLMLVDNINALELDYDYLKKGIELASYYASESLRLYENGHTDPKILKAENLILWLQDVWEEDYISLPDIYQNRSATPTQKEANEIVTVLESHNWLQRIEEGKEIKGNYRKKVWKIVKDVKYESIS